MEGRTRIAGAWNKWRKNLSLIMNKKIPLKRRQSFFSTCLRPVLLYGLEPWATTADMRRRIVSSNCKVMKYTACIRWEERIENEKVMIIVMIMRRRRMQ